MLTSAPGDRQILSHKHLEDFSRIVSQYASRSLTFPAHIVNAFLGIQDIISHNFRWNFAAGLPTGVFDWALLWVLHGQLERRAWTASDGTDISFVVVPAWVGWHKCPMHVTNTTASRFFITSRQGLRGLSSELERRNSRLGGKVRVFSTRTSRPISQTRWLRRVWRVRQLHYQTSISPLLQSSSSKPKQPQCWTK